MTGKAHKITREIYMRVKNDTRPDEEIMEAYKDLYLDKIVLAMIRAGANYLRIKQDWTKQISNIEQNNLRDLMNSISMDNREEKLQEIWDDRERRAIESMEEGYKLRVVK